MMQELFLTVLEISVVVGVMELLLFMLSPCLSKGYAAGWRYLVWTVLAVRLLVPVNWSPVESPLEFRIPTQVAIPIQASVSLQAAAENELDMAAGTEEALVTVTGTTQGAAVNIPFFTVATALWAVGCIAFFALHLISYLRFRMILGRKGWPVANPEILRQLDELRGSLGIRRSVSAVYCVGIFSPMTVGILSPLLVLPWEDYTDKELYFILKHELMHWKRRDVFAKLIFVAANAVHWFNPLVWMLRRRAEADMELACDEGVVRDLDAAGRKAYAEALLSALRGREGRGFILSTNFLGGTEIMMKRFESILDKRKKKSGHLLLCCSCVLMLAMGMLVGCQSAEPETAQRDAETSKEAEGETAEGTEPVGQDSGAQDQTVEPSANVHIMGYTYTEGSPENIPDRVTIVQSEVGESSESMSGWIYSGSSHSWEYYSDISHQELQELGEQYVMEKKQAEVMEAQRQQKLLEELTRLEEEKESEMQNLLEAQKRLEENELERQNLLEELAQLKEEKELEK